MEPVYDWIRGTVVIVLMLTVTEHLLPAPQYKKYLKLYGGLLLVFITVRFCVSLVGQEGWLEEKAEQAYREAERQETASLEDRLKAEDGSLVLDAYSREISEHVAQQLDSRGWQTKLVEPELTEEGLQGLRVTAVPPASQETLDREAARQGCEMLEQIYGLEEGRVVIRLVR